MIKFCRPRHDYQSYTDLWELVELSGYPLIYIDEIDTDSDTCYIVSSPDIHQSWPKEKSATIIFWLLEWYGDYKQPQGVKETWVSNETFARAINARFVPMGSHPGLGEHRTGSIFDIAHMSYAEIHRRRLVLDRLVEHGVNIAPNGWGDERHATLKNSRAMVHLHQHADYPAIAPLRASLAAAYALPLLAENGWSCEPYNDTILTYSPGTIVAGILAALTNDHLQEYGDKLHYLLCDELRFDKVIEESV